MPNSDNEAEEGGYGRDTGDNENGLNAAKGLFNCVMTDYGTIDSLQVTDLVGDNSILMMSEFANRMATNIPISPLTKSPYKPRSLEQMICKVCNYLQSKFRNQIQERGICFLMMS